MTTTKIKLTAKHIAHVLGIHRKVLAKKARREMLRLRRQRQTARWARVMREAIRGATWREPGDDVDITVVNLRNGIAGTFRGPVERNRHRADAFHDRALAWKAMKA